MSNYDVILSANGHVLMSATVYVPDKLQLVLRDNGDSKFAVLEQHVVNGEACAPTIKLDVFEHPREPKVPDDA